MKSSRLSTHSLKALVAFALMLFAAPSLSAQCSADPGLIVGPSDQYAFQWCNGTAPTNIGLMFASSVNEYQFKKADGSSVMTVNPLATGYVRMGDVDGGNYTSVSAGGDITFSGGADILVRNNTYAFRSQADQDNGLFFNVADNRCEFRANDASAGFTITANDAPGIPAGFFVAGGGNVLGTMTVQGNLSAVSNITVGGTINEAELSAAGNSLVIGKEALEISTGGLNTAIGYQAMKNALSGSYNLAIGAFVLNGITTGEANTAVGQITAQGMTSGSRNVALGEFTLNSCSSGSYNTAIGEQCGSYYTTGSYNTNVGSGAGTSFTNFDNSSGFGYNADQTASNQVRIGNTSVTSIRGQVGWTTTSDSRFKRQVSEEEVRGLDFITRLRPVTYTYDVDAYEQWYAQHHGEDRNGQWDGKYDIEEIRFSGFLAQEVEQIAQEVGYDFSGVDAPESEDDFYGLRYSEFVVPLVKAVQEQQEMIEAQESSMEQLNQQNHELLSRIEQLEEALAGITNSSRERNAEPCLGQNVPNPFSGSAVISYYLPEGQNGQIVIVDIKGQVVKEIAIQSGFGTLEIGQQELAAGQYSYSLISNGLVLATKKMVKVN